MIIIESNNNNKKSLFDHTRTFAAQIAQWILFHCGAHTHNHRPNQLGFQLVIYDYAQPQYRYGLWAKVISVWWTKLIEMVYGRIGRAANIHTHTPTSKTTVEATAQGKKYPQITTMAWHEFE